MIARLAGQILKKTPERIVLDVNGVGYDVLIPLSTFYKIGEVGQDVTLKIHTLLRDDAIVLFGFSEEAERQMFNLLKTVSGIGPKLALNILSGMEAPALAKAIYEGQMDQLTRIQGLGKKTAQRILVDLKEKASKIFAEGSVDPGAPLISFDQNDRDVISALLNLGYKQQLAEQALSKTKKKYPEVDDLEELLRQSLRSLSKAK